MRQEKMPEHSLALPLLLLPLLALAQNGSAADQDDKDCAGEMQVLAPCISYVSGGAARPSPDCCASAEKVRSQEPKCLCRLILRSTNTSLGLPINTTLALGMPAACHSSANVSECPRILKLEPGSPEAKIFENGVTPAAPGSSPPSPTSNTGRLSVEAILLSLIVAHLLSFAFFTVTV